MRIMNPSLATCQLATWAENAVKCELSNQKGKEKNKQKRGGCGVEDTVKINVRSVNKN